LSVVIEPLAKSHDRAGFSCGQPALDDWFRTRANQDDKRDVARVFVAVDSEFGVVGFHSVSAFSLSLTDVPEDLARKLPRYGVIPAALIGRLARDRRVRGRRVGELLLADAIRRILAASRSMAVFAIVVDAKDEHAVTFYKAFGFRPFPLRPQRLFLLSATAARAFA
jgi:ribosomal protein S18 acetylase RimI-like enzyme